MNGSGKPASMGQSRWPRGTLMSRLDALDARAADELLHLAVGQEYRPGAVLIRAGAPGTHVYLLQSAQRARSACVKVTATSENGVETLLGICASGDIVGELAVLGRVSRVATAITCATLTAHPIPGDAFVAFLDRRPQAWAAVNLMIAERLEWANRRRVDYASHDATIHIARVIADIVDLYGYRSAEGGEELGVSLSQPELGSLVGTSKEAAAKAVRRLRELGLVETRYRRIVVRDPAGLRSFAGLTAHS